MYIKNSYFSNNTERLLKSVLPSHYKCCNDKNTNLYKLISLMYGSEVDYLQDYLDYSINNNSLDNFDYSIDYDLSEVYLNDVKDNDYIYGDSIPIKITNPNEFYDGTPTRISLIDSLTISGYNNGISGIEFMKIDSVGSGYLIINFNNSSSNSYSSGIYQNILLNVSPLGEINTIPTSGDISGIKDNTTSYEFIVPLTEDFLRNEYPLKRIIYDINPNTSLRERFEIKHFTPDNGYYWDGSGYIAKGYNSDYYIKDDVITYYETALNNPFGSGIYTTEYHDLKYVPISGTLRLFDIDNLHNDLTPWEISQSGVILYRYIDENINYIGYYNTVPKEYLPTNYSGIIDALEYKTISWDYCINSSGTIINKIKLSYPSSRYIVTYKYVENEYVGPITSIYSNRYVRLYSDDYLTVTDPIEKEINYEFSKDTSFNNKVLSIHSNDIRPGSTIDRVEFNLVGTINDIIDSDNIVLNPQSEVIGYSNKIYPCNSNYDSIFSTSFYNDSRLVSNISGSSNICKIPFENEYGIRVQSIDNLYYSYSGYIPLITSNSGIYNTVFKIRMKFPYLYKKDSTIFMSSNGEEFIKISLIDRKVVIEKNDATYTSVERIKNNTEIKEIFIEYDSLYNIAMSDIDFNIYIKELNEPCIKIQCYRQFKSNSIPESSTILLASGYYDVQYIKINNIPIEFLRG